MAYRVNQDLMVFRFHSSTMPGMGALFVSQVHRVLKALMVHPESLDRLESQDYQDKEAHKDRRDLPVHRVNRVLQVAIFANYFP